MNLQSINRGTSAGDGTGESLFSAFGKVNGNSTALNTILFSGTAGQVLSSGGPGADPAWQAAGAPIGTLSQWFSGGIYGKTIVVSGDSTSDPTAGLPTLYTEFAFHQNIGELLEGVTIVPKGSNGQSASGFITDTGPKGLAAVAALHDDLYIVSFGINDVRQGNCDLPTLVSRLTTIITTLRAVTPGSDILLRKPNSLGITGDGYIVNITPQAATGILSAAYDQLANRWPNVVLWDAMREIFGFTATASGRGLMSDSLHPSEAGYISIADSITALIGQRRAPYNQFAALAAQQASFGTDYLVYPQAVEDAAEYMLISSGRFVGQGAGYIDFAGAAKIASQIMRSVDLVKMGSNTPFRITGTTGASGANTRILQTAPVTIEGGTVSVYRHRYLHDLSIKSHWQDTVEWPYRWRGIVVEVFSTGMDLTGFSGELRTANRVLQSGDVIVFAGAAAITIAGQSISPIGDNLRVITGSDMSAYSGLPFVVFGNHAYEDGSTSRRIHPDSVDQQAN